MSSRTGFLRRETRGFGTASGGFATDSGVGPADAVTVGSPGSAPPQPEMTSTTTTPHQLQIFMADSLLVVAPGTDQVDKVLSATNQRGAMHP